MRRQPRYFMSNTKTRKVIAVPELRAGSLDMPDAYRVASAVVFRALEDLAGRTVDPREDKSELRASAQRFLFADLWAPDCLWGALLRQRRPQILAEARKRLAEVGAFPAVAS